MLLRTNFSRERTTQRSSGKPVAGTAEIDVNDVTNTGKFEARLKIPEGDLVRSMPKME